MSLCSYVQKQKIMFFMPKTKDYGIKAPPKVSKLSS